MYLTFILQSYFCISCFLFYICLKKTANIYILGELLIFMYFAINFKFVGLPVNTYN